LSFRGPFKTGTQIDCETGQSGAPIRESGAFYEHPEQAERFGRRSPLPLPDVTGRLAGHQMRFPRQEVIDRGRQGVGVLEVFLVELEVGRISQLPGGPHQFGV
jgi:hypothetical protein